MRFLLPATLVFALTSLSAAQQPRPTAPRTPTPAKPTAPAPARPASRDAAVPFRVGETLTYDVSWSQFLTAGTAVTRVAAMNSSSGSSAYQIIADGRPVPLVERFYQVYYKMESLLDSVTLLSRSTLLYSEENGVKHQANTRFDRQGRRAYYDAPAESLTLDFEIPTNAQDGLAMLYAIRGRTFKAGERFTVPVADNGSMYSVEFETTSPEPVQVPLGQFTAWKLKTTILDIVQEPAAKNTLVWISTDARHMPVKLQSDLPMGTFVLALREAKP